MAGREEPEVEARIASLEGRVRLLEEDVARLHRRDDAPQAAAEAPHRTGPPITGFPPPRGPSLRMLPADPGQWVNRLGIALLLLGAAFGFKYSIDRGWIGPTMRVTGGLVLATLLVFASTRLRASRPGLSRLLAGGGIACAYLALYAAFHLYALLAGSAAFASMSVVTVIGFAVAVHDDLATSAMVAAAGGLATPFLLDGGSTNVTGLVVYTCIVVSGASAVFTWRGWTSVLATAAVGAWMVLATAIIDGGCDLSHDAGVTEGGMLFVALATWWLSVVRDTVAAEDPAAWAPATAGLEGDDDPTLFLPDTRWPSLAHQFALGTPVVLLFLSKLAWQTGERASGWIALSLAAGWGLAAVHLRRIDGDVARRLAATHAVAAAVMLAFAMAFVLDGDARRVGLGAEALALVVLATRSQSRISAMAGHLLFLAVGTESASSLLDAIHRNSPCAALADASTFAVVLALAAAAWLLANGAGDVYFFFAQAGLLTWLLRVLAPMTNGEAFVTAAWFADAVALVVAGLRFDSAVVRSAGAAVMTLTMAKLFFVDLATVDPLWRVITFLGFGVVLLGLGYAFPVLWRRPAGPGSAPPP